MITIVIRLQILSFHINSSNEHLAAIIIDCFDVLQEKPSLGKQGSGEPLAFLGACSPQLLVVNLVQFYYIFFHYSLSTRRFSP